VGDVAPYPLSPAPMPSSALKWYHHNGPGSLTTIPEREGSFKFQEAQFLVVK